jgi:hypothetical protein
MALHAATAMAQVSPVAVHPQPRPCATSGVENEADCAEPAGSGAGNLDVPVGGRSGTAASASRPGEGNILGGGGGGGDGRGLLVAAVIAAALLPVVVYALDDDAEPSERATYDAFQLHARASGGVLGINGQLSGLAELHASVEKSRFGLEGSFESSQPASEWRAAELAFLVRFVPTKHLELALAAGGRWSTLAGEQRWDAEFAVPQRYVFWHASGQSGGIELRPAVYAGAKGCDVRLDLGVVVPVGPVVALEVGGRLFTHDFQQVGSEALGSIGAKF